MKYLSADKIHDGHGWLPEGSVIAVQENGTIERILSPDTAGSVSVEHFPGILCPGFVNAHCHLELSHMRGVIEEGNRLVPFLQSVMLGRNNFSEQDKANAIEEAIAESLRNGIVAVGDIANGPDTFPFREQSGLHIHTFVESIGFTETNLEDRFAWPVHVLGKFSAQVADGFLLRQSIVPHAPYSVSAGMFARISHFDPDSLISIHNEETAAENEFYRGKTGEMFDLYQTLNINTDFFQPSGKSSLQTYMPYLSAEHPVLLVHNTFTDAHDLEWLQASGRKVSLCLCPNANWYIERRMPPVALFMNSGLPICLGTDSLASNHQLSIWAEVQTLQQHFPELTLETLLQWATHNGAKALQMDNIVGSLEAGKRPGIVNIDLEERVKKVF